MPYFIYREKEYFGYTYSKRIVKKLKEMEPHIVSIPFDEDHLNDDQKFISTDYDRIQILYLDNQYGERVPVVSTEREQEEASLWVNQQIIELLLLENVTLAEQVGTLPSRIQMVLGTYYPCDVESMIRDDGLIYDLTYEGYLWYLNNERGKKRGKTSGDLCLLP